MSMESGGTNSVTKTNFNKGIIDYLDICSYFNSQLATGPFIYF